MKNNTQKEVNQVLKNWDEPITYERFYHYLELAICFVKQEPKIFGGYLSTINLLNPQYSLGIILFLTSEFGGLPGPEGNFIKECKENIEMANDWRDKRFK